MSKNQNTSTGNSKPKAFLMILDGYGLRYRKEGNAVKLAHTPYLNTLFPDPPQGTLNASGREVGLPRGLMGNSEVGHLNLGAGRIVYQLITRIDLSIQNGEFYKNQVLLDSINYAKNHNVPWHLLGLVSDGGVHSSLNHLYALLRLAKENDLKEVYLHAFTDGRDTPPYSGAEFIRQVTDKMEEIGVGKIASICGRYWGMDRDHRWDRVEKAYRMFTSGEGKTFAHPFEAVADSYRQKITDEFIEPSVIAEDSELFRPIRSGDGVLFFNFRADRARELTWTLNEKKMEHFEHQPLDLHFTTLTSYHEDFNYPVAFPPEKLKNILGEIISKAGLKQFRTAETEKYAHVTFFFNGGIDTPFHNEDRLLITSPSVRTYDLQPEMNAELVTRHVLEVIEEDYSFILLNFANPDMVGHTGNLQAVIKALEALDPMVESIIEKAKKYGFTVLVTADHGNCEMMIDSDGGPHTAHTTNRVPLAIIKPDGNKPPLHQHGILADVAPTVLSILKLEIPDDMTGKNLIV
jgi:2,3-bisphosphoglycerate-independent phosphoglycerate mutase